MATKTKTKRTRNRAQNAQHQRAFQARRKAGEKMIQAVAESGGVQYELTPVEDGDHPLEKGIKITWVLSQDARDAITTYAASEPNTTFEGMLEHMKMRLVAGLFEAGFFQWDYRIKGGDNG